MELLLLTLSCVLSRSLGEDYLPSPYHYEYSVHHDKDHLDFGHEETGDGGGTVQGSYQVKLPDGRLQHVSYTVSGDSGYVARVSYDGHAVHPPVYGHGHGLGHGHRLGKTAQNFPSLQQPARPPKFERPVTVSSVDTLEAVVGSVFEEKPRPSITFDKPSNERLEFTPVFSSKPQQQQQFFGAPGVFGLRNQPLQPVGQQFLFPQAGTFQNLPPNEFLIQKPKVKTTVISGKSGFRSGGGGGLPKREATDYVNKEEGEVLISEE